MAPGRRRGAVWLGVGIDIWGGDGCPFSHLQRGGTPTGHEEEGVRVGGSLDQKGKCFLLSGELEKQFRCSLIYDGQRGFLREAR